MFIFNKKMKINFCLGCFLFVQLISLYAIIDIPSPNESAEIRKNSLEQWILAPIDVIALQQPQVCRNTAGQVFQIRVEETSDSYVIAVLPFTNGQYMLSGEGSWFLYRNKKTGNPTHIRLYPIDDSEIYIQLYYSDSKVFADFLLYGAYAARGVPLGITFERLYSLPLKDLKRITAQSLPWQYTEIISSLYGNTKLMVDVIRSNLSRFEYLNDTGYNAKGEPIFISTEKPRPMIFDGEQGNNIPKGTEKLYVSSAGFVKWIIDGLVKPLVGNGLILNSLKAPTVQTEGTHMEPYITTREPYFLLDWVRHLASGYSSASSGRTLLPSLSGTDVTIEPFSEMSVYIDDTRKVVNTVGYMPNAGYRSEILKPLLYVLAINEPDRFFLGAVRTAYGNNPTLPQFLQAVAFFPYFDSDNVFQVAVFANGKELFFEEFIAQNKGNFVHLERAKSSSEFYPQ